MTEKTESKADDTTTDEEHPLDVARAEGLRRAPLSQTQHLDTTEGGVVDIRLISPVFEEARQHAVRQAAKAVEDDEEYGTDTVVFPDDKDEADRAKEHVRKLAAELPEEGDDVTPGPDGHGGPYGQGVTAEQAEENADKGDDKAATASSTTKAAAKPTTTRATAAKSTTK